MVVPAESERLQEDAPRSRQLRSLSRMVGNDVVVIPNLPIMNSQTGLCSKGRCGVRYNGLGSRIRRRESIHRRDIQFLRRPTVPHETGIATLADRVRIRERTPMSL